MLRPAFAAFAFAVIAALSSAADAQNSDSSRNGVAGSPFYFQFSHRNDDRHVIEDHSRPIERHSHHKLGERVDHNHPIEQGHDFGLGWSAAKRYEDTQSRRVSPIETHRRDGLTERPAQFDGASHSMQQRETQRLNQRLQERRNARRFGERR